MRSFDSSRREAARARRRRLMGRLRNALFIVNLVVGAIVAGLYVSLGLWWLVRWIVMEN